MHKLPVRGSSPPPPQHLIATTFRPCKTLKSSINTFPSTPTSSTTTQQIYIVILINIHNPTMAKLAVMILLIAVATASAFRYRGDECEREVEQHMPMSSCMRWAESKMRSGPYRRHGGEEEHLEECCSELRRVSSQCRCGAVKEMMMEMPQQVEMQRMMCTLPTMCRMSPCSCPRFFD